MGERPGSADRLIDPITCWIWLADTALLRDEHHALLTAQERARAAAFLHAEDRTRFVTAAVLLRLLVGDLNGIAAERVDVDRACDRCGAAHGRPRLPGTRLHASISHSATLAVVALTTGAPVGVDVERIHPTDVVGLARLCLAPTETVERDEDFFRYWTRKESVVKATGDGMRVPLSGVVVRPAHEPAGLLRYPGRPVRASMADLDLAAHGAPGYAGAVTVLAAAPLDVVVRDAGDLLRTFGQALPDEVHEGPDRLQ